MDQSVAPQQGCAAPWSEVESGLGHSLEVGMNRAMDVGIEVGNVTTAAVGAFASGVIGLANGHVKANFG